VSRRSDEGSATVLALAVCAVVALAAAVLAGSGLAAVTRHRAALAADAAALAAAARSTAGTGVACQVARRAVEANGARLGRCSVEGPYVVVRDLVPAPAWMAWAGAAVGEARAGPDADAEKTGGVATAS
jgi:secretion/DNA translocation related TadE-like protein